MNTEYNINRIKRNNTMHVLYMSKYLLEAYAYNVLNNLTKPFKNYEYDE